MLLGGAGNDTLDGGEAADSLTGGAGSVTLSGNASADLLIGRRGDDTLKGGAGDDLYVYYRGDVPGHPSRTMRRSLRRKRPMIPGRRKYAQTRSAN